MSPLPGTWVSVCVWEGGGCSEVVGMGNPWLLLMVYGVMAGFV